MVVPEHVAAAPTSTPWKQFKSTVKTWLGRESARQESVPIEPVLPPVEAELPPAPAAPTRASAVEAFLATHRPERLHLNACGDFQLMSRDNWFALGGYAEFQMYSMNIDGLLGHTAYCAGVREYVYEWPACAYHIEHEAGSGWTPEGEEKLRQRIAARGIGWLDNVAVSMLASFMRSVGQPIFFNGPDWGFARHRLPESLVRDDAVIQ